MSAIRMQLTACKNPENLTVFWNQLKLAPAQYRLYLIFLELSVSPIEPALLKQNKKVNRLQVSYSEVSYKFVI